MMYYDTHCHIDLGDNIQEIINESEHEKIYILAMTNLPILFDKLDKSLSSKYIRACLGFHPELVFKYKFLIPKMWEYLERTKYIGEVGLDFKKNTTIEEKEVQIEFLKELISRCNSTERKILSLHSRAAEKEVDAIIKNNFNGTLIFHWYSGGVTIMKNLLKKGAYFSINKAMTNSKSGKNIIKNIPLNKILLETDFPFVKTTETKYKKLVLDQIIFEISKIKNITTIETEKILSDNFKFIIKRNITI